MICFTRQLRKALDKLRGELREELNQQKSAIHAAEERCHEQKEIENKYLEKILSAYQHAKGNEACDAKRNYRVQNSLRWATWFAFGAAFIYGAIAWCQMETMKRQLDDFETKESAQLVIENFAPNFVMNGDSYQVNFIVSIRNAGSTVAKYVSNASNSNAPIDPKSIHLGKTGRSLAPNDVMTIHGGGGGGQLSPYKVSQGYEMHYYVVVGYWDIWGNPHTEPLCVRYRSWKSEDYRWVMCGTDQKATAN
jgi:hypothetical protein